MAQQHINYSQPGDHLGDTLRTSQVKAESNFTELYNNKVDKETGKSLTDNNFSDADKTKLDSLSNDAVTQSDWSEGDNLDPAYIKNKPENLSDFFNDLPQYLNAVGSFHYSDDATQTTPISVMSGVEAKLTNDTLGIYTNVSNAPFGVSTLWNPSTNQFDFSQLTVGDLVKIRPDLNIDLIGTNTSYQLYMKMAIGSATPWTLVLSNSERKSTSEFNDVNLISFDIANEETKDFPAELYILTDAGATVKVNGWYLEVVRKNINIVDISGDFEDLDNKQNSLTVDGTGTKYPTVDAVNAGLALKADTGDIISDHTALSNIGTNTHSQIDTALNRLENTSGTNTGDQDLIDAVEVRNVTGSIQIDLRNKTQYLTMTGNSTFNFLPAGLPTASNKSVTTTVYLKGAFTLTVGTPTLGIRLLTGSYTGTATKWNLFTIEVAMIDVGTGNQNWTIQISEPETQNTY